METACDCRSLDVESQEFQSLAIWNSFTRSTDNERCAGYFEEEPAVVHKLTFAMSFPFLSFSDIPILEEERKERFQRLPTSTAGF